jgi:hypothetical protein
VGKGKLCPLITFRKSRVIDSRTRKNGMTQEDPEFEKFWQAYPRKRSKGDARKAWIQTAKRRPSIMGMMKAIAVLCASDDWQKDGGQFIPYPAGFLRRECWEDVTDIQMAQVTADGKMWWETNSGVERKAKEMGEEWDARLETWQMFIERLKRKAKVVPIQEARQVSA